MTPRPDDPWRLPGLEIAPFAPPRETDWLWSRVVPPPPEIAAHVREGGLELADPRDIDGAMFAEAAVDISAVPSLLAIVATRVRSVHLVRANPGYDVSHSEPQWRDRIFVSVPERSDRIGALRLAESVIHEALHLHLTELEAIAPLVRDLSGKLVSPWRPEPRPSGGVLHGVFVFAGLTAYFRLLREPSKSAAGRYLRQRQGEIAAELAAIDSAALGDGLTEPGAALLSRLITPREAARPRLNVIVGPGERLVPGRCPMPAAGAKALGCFTMRIPVEVGL